MIIERSIDPIEYNISETAREVIASILDDVNGVHGLDLTSTDVKRVTIRIDVVNGHGERIR